MNRFLHRFNLLGVLAVAALCVVQWRTNRQLHHEAYRHEQALREQRRSIDEQTRASTGQAGDLASLREHLKRLTAEMEQGATKLAAAERQLLQAVAERDQLKSSASNWAAAVAARDQRLSEAAGQLKSLAEARNDAVTKFNDLAGRHNQLVKEWNELQTRLAEQARDSARTNR